MKNLIEIKSGKTIKEHAFRSLQKNILFGGEIREDVANLLGYSVVLNDPLPKHDKISHWVKPLNVEKRDNRWHQTWSIELRPDAIDRIRSHRNRLLAQSDWTQVSDAPVDQAAWATYRQALRDVPQQAGFPHDVTWPTAPT